ncbi:unnamed protein product [Prorocentrum cordatum]|uniref:Uncharacterized protein n=1 Tax=Prorocentrum cordatum TaxID=2364126 RepID=A0ABN9SLW8_9DINO|nr:unnamed protein product [Polarella glacialis]
MKTPRRAALHTAGRQRRVGGCRVCERRAAAGRRRARAAASIPSADREKLRSHAKTTEIRERERGGERERENKEIEKEKENGVNGAWRAKATDHTTRASGIEPEFRTACCGGESDMLSLSVYAGNTNQIDN